MKTLIITLILSTLAMTTHATTIRFNDTTSLPDWAIVNDSVMGGISQSRIEPAENVHRFTGSVSLENNGGFASVRYLVARALPNTDRIQLRIKGDGKLYQLRFRMSGQYRAVAYSVNFQTLADEWQTFTFLTDDFKPVWRGRTVVGAPELDLNAVQIMSIFVSDKQTGPFAIELDQVAFVNEPEPSS